MEVATPFEFRLFEGSVWLVGRLRPARLADRDVENLLDAFEEIGAFEAFNSLYDLHRKNGGIERASSMKGAICNTPRRAA